jgi:hypothetical protein
MIRADIAPALWTASYIGGINRDICRRQRAAGGHSQLTRLPLPSGLIKGTI